MQLCGKLDCDVSISLMLNGYYVISSEAHRLYHIMVNGNLFRNKPIIYAYIGAYHSNLESSFFALSRVHVLDLGL